MRWAAWTMTLLFGFAAAVQYNDPDPARWILAYLFAAGISLRAALGRFEFVSSAIAALLFGIGFAVFASSLVGADPAAFQSIKMRAPEHEMPREAFGLGLCAAWFFVLTVYSYRVSRQGAVSITG